MNVENTTGLNKCSRGPVEFPSIQVGTPGMIESITGVVLAGGASRRMGADKSFLDLGGKPIVRHVIDTLTQLFSRVIIITNDREKYARFGMPTLADIIPGVGTLGGIHAGLHYLRDRAGFFVTSDMPFIKPAVI